MFHAAILQNSGYSMPMQSDLRVLPCVALALTLLSISPVVISPVLAGDTGIPQLRKMGSATQLVVDGKPWVMLAGEVHNSSASGVEYMRRMWPHLKALGLNTVLAPVSWELLEPVEGEFDFTCVDTLLELARKYDQRLVLLWFGSWKNGVSSYAPFWVLKDTARFPAPRAPAVRTRRRCSRR